MGEGMFKKSAFEFKYTIAPMRIFRTHPYPPCGVLLVRFLPTWAENERKNTSPKARNEHITFCGFPLVTFLQLLAGK